ncbi:MAG: hypothetical protein A2749_02580 [Parcubacteria group bacterium RIFCSPHIGHO2_01_FULL_45_26]|nr:MAG: hypothetical protein A2749_02580 [Parcubacteria group bacterium RIFCSPHIGHO2_01_FULL_45_26]
MLSLVNSKDLQIKLFIISLVFFGVLAYLLPTSLIDTDYGNVILTIATFLLGIFAGFCILVTTNDYNSVRELAADETAGWISLYNNVQVYDADSALKLKPLLSEYIIRSFDYDFIDYARETKPEFRPIQDLINSLPVMESKSSVHQNILDRIADVTKARQHLTALGNRSLSRLEWLVLFMLSFTVIATLYGLRTGSPFFDFVTIAVSSAIVMILELTYDIDRYMWNDASFGFETYNNVLVAMGELPYYRQDFLQRRIVVPLEKKYQIGILSNHGKSWERKIEIVDKK